MKKLILITTFFLSLSTFSSENWTTKTIVEGSSENLYVGVSSPRDNLKDALAEAYNEAIKEAVKHNFGFNQTLQENFFSTLQNTEIQQQSFLKLDNIQIRGVAPINQKIEESNSKFIVYRQISYDKKEIEAEKKRLKSIFKEKEITNVYNSSGFKGNLSVYTVPTQAQVVVTSEDGKTTLTGTSNGKFNLPLGKYNVFIQKKGYKVYEKEIIVADEKTEIKTNLIPATGFISVISNPPEALVYLDGRQITNELELIAGKEYKIRVEHPDFYSKEETFELMENYVKNIKVNLDPRDGTVSIFSSPDGAEVWIDSTLVGKTPLINLKLTAGSHFLAVSKEGYDTVSKNIKVQPNTTTKPYHIDLQQESTKQRPVYDRDAKKVISSQTQQLSISYKTYSNFLDFEDLKLKSKGISYNEGSVGMVDFEYKKRLGEWLGVYAQFGFAFREIGVNKQQLQIGQYTEDATMFGIGLPIYVTDRFSITPKLSMFSYNHYSNLAVGYGSEILEVNASGYYAGLNATMDLFRGQDAGLSVIVETIRPQTVKTTYTKNPLNMNEQVKKKDTIVFGLALTLFWD